MKYLYCLDVRKILLKFRIKDKNQSELLLQIKINSNSIPNSMGNSTLYRRALPNSIFTTLLANNFFKNKKRQDSLCDSTKPYKIVPYTQGITITSACCKSAYSKISAIVNFKINTTIKPAMTCQNLNSLNNSI